MKLRIGILVVVLALCSGRLLRAQYFQYSQYNFTGQRVNPAPIGLTRYATASTDFRHQKTGGDFSINSNFLSLTYPLLNSSTGQPWAGIGLAFHNDQSSGIFRTQEAALSYAVHIRLNRWQTLSLGGKGLFQSRRISLDGFYTGSQYVPDRGFDPSSSSGENIAEYRTSYNTFSAGAYWQEVDKKGRVLRYFGFSLFDFNKPNDSFLGNPDELSSTFVVHTAFEAYSQSDLHIFPEGLLTYSASKAMLNAGLRFQKELNPKAKQLSDRVEVITKYAIGRSGIVGIQLHRENFSMGLSYDFPLLRTNAGNLGALEVGIELRKLVSTRAQKLTAKRKKAAEEKKQALAQKNQPKETKPKELTPKPVRVAITADTATAAVIPAVEIVQSGTSGTLPQTSAKAGTIKQEPLIIEKVTLHFAFEFNSADLDEPTESFLQELTTTLQENENLKLHITGHTDNIGSDKFNMHLSQKRADAVKRHLVKMGISHDRMISEGKGMHEPLNENSTDAERAKNRRVEIMIYY
jgi:type IX secretion system PorP/SprF family membrane protein